MNHSITANGKSYRVFTFTGTVLNASKNMETRVSGGGGGGYSYRGTGSTAPVHITSTTVVHDQIFLQDKGGLERSLQLADFNVACREGNVLSAVWLVREGENAGPYVAVYNHTTQQPFFNDPALKRIFKYNPAWLKIVLGAVGFMLGGGGGIGVAIVCAVVGAGIGWALRFPDKKAIASFKAGLQFNEESSALSSAAKVGDTLPIV